MGLLWNRTCEKCSGDLCAEAIEDAKYNAKRMGFDQDKPGQGRLIIALVQRDKLIVERVQGCPCCTMHLKRWSSLLNVRLWQNRHLEFMVDYESRKTITLGELMPLWWGEERARQKRK